MKKMFACLCVCFSLILGLSANATDDSTAQVRVFISDTVNLIFVQDSILSLGGNIQDYTPERAFIVLINRDALAGLSSIAGVKEVREITPEPPQPLLLGIPGLGDVPPTPEDQELINQYYRPVESIEPSNLAQERALLAGTVGRPPAVDNSASIFFPPIDTQGGQKSCTAWATCYYYNTYTQSKDETVDVTGGVSDTIASGYIGSPAFLYNLMNNGIDQGANTSAVVARLNEVGCASWKTMPYNQYDYTSWPSKDAWVDALKFRTKSSGFIPLWRSDHSSQGIELLRQVLANGEVAVTRTNVYGNWHPFFLDNQNRGIQNSVLFSHSGETYNGSHALTFVGYNDNRQYNDHGTIKRGAFLVANSWGSWWGTKNTTNKNGFMWVAYDYILNNQYVFGEAYINQDRPNYRPQLFVQGSLLHTQRGYDSFTGGIGSPNQPNFISYYAIRNNGDINHIISPGDGGHVAVDLTDGISPSSSCSEFSLFGKMAVDARAASKGILNYANFFQDFDKDGIYTLKPSLEYAVEIPPGSAGFATAKISPVKSVNIDGPAVATGNGRYTFTATVAPNTATGPIVYRWNTTDQSEIIHTSLGLQDSVSFAWSSTGPKQISVTTENIMEHQSHCTANKTLVSDVQQLHVRPQGIVCPDGQFGFKITLSGTSARSIYNIYSTDSLFPFHPWIAIATLQGRDGSTDWLDCRRPFPDVAFYTAALQGDLNLGGPGGADNIIDKNDLNLILAARNTRATGPNDPRDLDGDGMITALDARKLTLLCTRPGCATQ